MNNVSGSVGVTSDIDARAVTTTAPPFRTALSASLIIAPSSRPGVRMAESAMTPCVVSPINWVASSIEAAKCVAPN